METAQTDFQSLAMTAAAAAVEWLFRPSSLRMDSWFLQRKGGMGAGPWGVKYEST